MKTLIIITIVSVLGIKSGLSQTISSSEAIQRKIRSILTSKHTGCKKQLLESPEMTIANLTGQKVVSIIISNKQHFEFGNLPWYSTEDVSLVFLNEQDESKSVLKLKDCQYKSSSQSTAGAML